MARLNHETAKAEVLSAGYEPIEKYPGRTDAKWKAIHVKCGREVYVRLTRLRCGEGSCRSCGQRGRTDNKTNPVLARRKMIERGFEPLEDFPGSVDSAWKSKCLQCGDISPRRYANVVLSGQGCKSCWQKCLSQSKRINEDEAFEVMLASKLRPVEPYPGANSPWKSTCVECGGTVTPTLSSVKRGVGCRRCGYMSTAAKLLTPSEVAVSEFIEAGYAPIEDFGRANDPWGCIHIACGSELSVSLTRIRAGWRPCQKCNPAVRGRFNRNSPAVVYVLHHAKLGAVKVGIAGASSNRLKIFEQYGWTLFHRRGFKSGSTAWEVEQAILRYIRKTLGYAPHLSADEMRPMTGWTETTSADLLAPQDLRDLIESIP